MTNASIYFHPDGYDTTSTRLMGRHSAGESFLRGLIRHADVEEFHFFNASPKPPATFQPLLDRIEPTTKPIHWVDRRERPRLATPGCLYHPTPGIASEAWLRRPFGSTTYSLTGITHTTASHRVMDALADMLTAPLEPWDALICTSKAVIDSVEVLLGAARQDLAERLGATRFASPQLVTIPLGVNTSDFAASHEHRKAWREKLDIPQDAIVALYVGRLSPAGKMNPAPMALALEAAAQETGRDIYWIVSGWAGTPEFSQAYHDQTRALCPSIHYRSIDGRPADTRFSIWSAADLFISLPENIQETFGLTPIEAMAAGLPCVVTDWNGYRDTVRDGLDGFRVATTAPRPSLGRDLAYAHANEWVNYDQYISAAAAVIAIDLRAATQALVQLITQPDLRRRMGETALRQAREVFDWATIIPQYQALWGELAARRTAVTPTANPHDNPRKLDPFKLFAGYPTQALSPQTKVCVVPGMTWPVAEARLGSPLGIIGHWALPFPPERKVMFEYFQAHGSATVADMLADITPRRRPFMERGVLWLVKFGILEFV